MARNTKPKPQETPEKEEKGKQEKIIYPKEFHYFRQEAHVKLKPNSKNTFIVSKYKKEAKTLHSTTHQYVSMHEIQEAGEYNLRAYIVPTEFKKTFETNIYAEYCILALQNEDDEREFLPVFAVSFEALKCPACYGSGYFKNVVKNNFATVLGNKTNTQIPPKGALAKAQGASELHSNICHYNHANQMGCGGTGIDATANLAYQEKLMELFKFNNESMMDFMRFARTAPRKQSVFYSGEDFDFSGGGKKETPKPKSALPSFGKVELE